MYLNRFAFSKVPASRSPISRSREEAWDGNFLTDNRSNAHTGTSEQEREQSADSTKMHTGASIFKTEERCGVAMKLER